MRSTRNAGKTDRRKSILTRECQRRHSGSHHDIDECRVKTLLLKAKNPPACTEGVRLAGF